MANELNLGMGIVFDDSTLRQLNSILTYVQKLQKQFDGIGDPLKKMKQPIVDANAQFDKLKNKVNQGTNALNNSKKAVKGLGDSLVHNVKKMAEWAVSATLLYGTIRGLQSAFKTMVDLETEAVNIAKVLPKNVALQPFEERAIKLAKQYGQSVIDVEKATANWAKQYKNVQDVAIATQASLLAATATDIGFEQSVKSLSAIIAEWNLEAKDSIHIVDMLNEVSNNYRVTAEGVAEALAKSGSGAKALGMTMEQLTGIVTTGIQALGMEGNTVGTFWTRTMARMRGNDSAVAAIKNLGIDAMQPLSTLMDEIAAKWDLMTSGEKQNFAITVAGTQHWSRFTGIMDNYNTVIEATAKSYDSFNSAQEEVNRVMETTAKCIQQLNATWQEYIYRNNGVLSITKGVIEALRNLVTGLALFNPLTVIASIAALTLIFKGLFAAIMSTTTAFSVMTVGLLSNPWTAVIVAIGAVAGALLLMGNNANKAQNQIFEMQNQLAKFDQYNEGMINKSRGIIDLANKYEIYQKAIEKAKNAGQDYSKLLDKFKVAQTELAKAVGVSNAELEMMVKRDGGIKTFVENRLRENAALINSERDKANAIKESTRADLERQLKPKRTLLAELQQEYQKHLYQLESASYDGNSFKMTQARINAERTKSNIDRLKAGMRSAEDALKDTKLDTRITTVEDFYHKAIGATGDVIGLDTTDLKDKIQPIFTTLTSETLTLIETIGRAWQTEINKSLSSDEQLKNDKATYLFKSGLGYDSMSTDINNKIRDDLTRIFKSIDDSSQQFAQTQLNIDSQRQKALLQGSSPMEAQKQAEESFIKASDEYAKKLDEQYQSLIEVASGLDLSKAEFQPFVDYLSKLGLKIRDLEDTTKIPTKYSKKQLDYINTAFDSLSSALSNMGTVAGDVAAIITNSFSKNFGLDGLNVENFTQSIGTGLLDMAIGGIFGKLFGGKSKRTPVEVYQAEQYDVFSALAERNRQNGRLQEIAGLQAKTSNLNNYYRRVSSGRGPSFVFMKGEYLDDLDRIAALKNEILQAIDSWSQAIGTSINDIASKIEDAFDATNAFDFLQNWNQSLYEMTRTALIRGFMAQEAFQGLYKELSQTISLAVMDGVLTANELSAIRSAGNNLGQQMQLLYQALNGLEGAFGIMPGSSGSEQSYTAGTSQAIVINNYVNIYGTYFGEDEDGLREFSLIVAREIAREQGRA